MPRQGHNTPVPLERSPPVSFRRLLGSTRTQLLKQCSQGQWIGGRVDTFLANPIQIWIPDAYARELVPVALIATPLEEVVNVLGDLVFRADDPSPPVYPGKQQENECGNKKSAEHACCLTDRA